MNDDCFAVYILNRIETRAPTQTPLDKETASPSTTAVCMHYARVETSMGGKNGDCVGEISTTMLLTRDTRFSLVLYSNCVAVNERQGRSHRL